MRCGIYTRVSTDEQAKSSYSSLDRQREVCESYVGIHRESGWFVAQVYGDPGFSGKDLNRPGIHSLLEDVRQGKLDLVIAYKIDRITRSLKDFYDLWDILQEHDVAFVTASEQFDTSTPTGKLMLNMLLSFAQFERELTRERTMSKMAGRAERGLWNGGWVPLGYDYQKESQLLLPNPEEAERVRYLFRRMIETASPSAVVKDAKRRGYRTKQRIILSRAGLEKPVGGKRLDEDFVKRVVRNPIYKGYIRYSGQLFPGCHEPLVDEETWSQANDSFGSSRPAGEVHHKDDHVHLLKGLLTCGPCEREMTPYPSGKKDSQGQPYLYYSCTSVTEDGKESGCAVRSLPARAFERLITSALTDLGNSPEILAACIREANGNATVLVEELQNTSQACLSRVGEINKGINRVIEFIKAHDSVPSEVEEELSSLDTERDQLRQEIDKIQLELAQRQKRLLDAQLVHHQLRDFESLVKVLPLEDQKELFDLLLQEVRVYPFDPESSDQERGERLRVAGTRGRLYEVEIAVHQLSKGALECLPRGESSENRKFGSPGRIRTYDLAVNSRPLYR